MNTIRDVYGFKTFSFPVIIIAINTSRKQKMSNRM